MKRLHEYDPLSKEYAELDVNYVDLLAFGCSEESIVAEGVHPNELNIRWEDDMENPKEQIRIFIKNGGTEKEWAESVDLSDPIELSHKDGKLYIEDGHHRYTAAKILNKRLAVAAVTFRDNPYIYAVKQNELRKAINDLPTGKNTKITPLL